MADILALYFVPLNFRWVSKREVFRIPYIGQMLSIHGDIAIDRSRGADSMRKVTEKGKMWIGRGVSIAMFPEGTRSKSGEMGRFKQGAFALAKDATLREQALEDAAKTDRIVEAARKSAADGKKVTL